jgi:hypothetical protein
VLSNCLGNVALQGKINFGGLIVLN